jgi:hypothetical protein
MSEPMNHERPLIEASHSTSSHFRSSIVSSQRRTAGGKKSGKLRSQKPGVSSSGVTSSSSTMESSSSNPGNKPTFTTVNETKAQFLENEEMDDSNKTLIWKGVGDYYMNLFQQRGRWEREFARVSGDLSTGTAIYYTSSKRYALAYGAYKLTPVTWQKNTIAGAHIFEAVLTDANLSIVHLDHSDDVHVVLAVFLFEFMILVDVKQLRDCPSFNPIQDSSSRSYKGGLGYCVWSVED